MRAIAIASIIAAEFTSAAPADCLDQRVDILNHVACYPTGLDKIESGPIFAPLAMGGAGGLRAWGTPAERLAHWLLGMDTACLTAMRHLDEIEAWSAQAEIEMTRLSGKTPPALR